MGVNTREGTGEGVGMGTGETIVGEDEEIGTSAAVGAIVTTASGSREMTFERSLPGFTYAIDSPPGMSCIVCHGIERAFLFRKGEGQVGICENCSSLAQWAWRQLAGEVAPGSPEEPVISRVYALACRRRRVPKADAPLDAPEEKRMVLAPAEINSSYEFLLVGQPDGSLDLPSVAGLGIPSSGDLGKSLVGAATRALSDVALSSWDAALEPMYLAYTPRGHLVSIVLVRAWGEGAPVSGHPGSGGRCWKPWPVAAHVGAMAGFWRSLETVWSLRLHKHCVAGEPEDICVQVRRAGREYIALQAAARDDRQADASMLLALQAGMSADEIAVARMLHLAAGRGRDEKALAALPPSKSHLRVPRKPVARPKPAPEPEPDDMWPEMAVPGGGEGVEEAPEDSEEDQDQNDVVDDEHGEPDASGFVRPGRPLRQE